MAPLWVARLCQATYVTVETQVMCIVMQTLYTQVVSKGGALVTAGDRQYVGFSNHHSDGRTASACAI
jgi:hypothetical protein